MTGYESSEYETAVGTKRLVTRRISDTILHINTKNGLLNIKKSYLQSSQYLTAV